MIGTRSIDAVEYIFSRDEALDKAHPDYNWEEYIATCDSKYAPLKEGHTPTVFQVRKLSRKQYVKISALPDEQKWGEAIAFGLKGIKNFCRPVQLLMKNVPELGERLKDDVLDDIFAPELFVELGLRILTLSTLDPKYGQGS